MVERTLISLPSQLQLIERLQHLIYLSSSLIFVSGESGSGKSTLTENLSNTLDSDLQQIYISLANAPTAEQIRQQIVGQLYDRPLFNADDNLLDTILRLHASESKQTNKLLIIDNANNLPKGFILELCELFSGEDFVQDTALNILLLADEAANQQSLDYIEDNLISRMKSALNHVEFKLPTLSGQESLSLLQHNFQQVDYQPELQHQEALRHQLKQCNGNPQKIIQLAEDLSQGEIAPQRNYWLKTALPAILLMFVLVAIVSYFGNYLYPLLIAEKVEDETLSTVDVSQPVDEEKIANTDTLTEVVSEKAEDEEALVEDELQEALAGSWNKSEDEITDNKKEVGLADKKGERTVLSDQQLFELTLFSEASKVKPIESEDSVKSELPVKRVTTTPVSAPTPVSVQPVTTPVLTNEKAEEGTLLSALAKKIDLKEKATKKIEPSKSAKASKATPQNSVLESVQKSGEFTPTNILLAKSADHYTLQLSGMASKRYFSLFKKQYNFPQENLFLYETVYKNKPWFVVLYGDYDSVASAQLAAKKLPGDFNGMPSWVKQWQLVHNELRLTDE